DIAMRKKTILYGILVLIFLLAGTILALAASQSELPGDDPLRNEPAAGGVRVAYLYTGSPLILSDGEVKMLDPTNPDLGATVIDSNTLVPMKAISEYFGAEVVYDEANKAAIVKYDGKEYVFPVGSKKYTVRDGLIKHEYTMSSQSLILEGRTMVPLRVICEDVLGRKVSYFDRIIAVADYEIDLQSNTGLAETVRGKIGEAVKARTMAELEKAMTVQREAENFYFDAASGAGEMRNSMNGSTTAESAAPAASAPVADQGLAPAAKQKSVAGDDSYSTTNLQVEGIDEADIVKTDGKYIYIAGNNAVRIVGADQGKLSDDTAIRLSTDKNVSEIYVDGDRLVLLGTRSEYERYVSDTVEPAVDLPEGAAVESAAAAAPIEDFASGSAASPPIVIEKRIGIMPPYNPPKNYSFVDVYDISDPLRPVFLKGHEMEGSYQSSRKNGDIVYLVTNSYPSGGIVLPMMRDTTVSSKEFSMKLNDVMIMPRHPSPGYLVISAINVKSDEKTETEAITAYGATMYMNDSSLYLAYNDQGDKTSIIKFVLEGMKVGYAGSGEVPGNLLNQFSMDEYEGNLRVAVTEWNSKNGSNSNGLYILDPSLNITGSVKDLAEGESIYSVRFMGDKGYVVTFRTIDPLFVFDLSDPKKPVLTGELKVPGFSNYLHPVGEDLLLGIGMDTYDIYKKDSSGREVVVGIRQGGIKFSLFDVSDMGKPKEISTYVVGDEGSGSEALYNHKAIMFDLSNENVAFDAYINQENPQKGYQQGAIIMNFAGKKLTLKGILDSEPSGIYGNYIPYARRVLYINDELYYVQEGRITSYDYDSLKQIDSLTLQ
ncbi:MAG TPA: beta-propeller domain-containing protein, partial [Anaerovoracaceae bacterium]|nr:beta-propeller domain-containing protein [Anaerovoracaceae bacterium]